jgi:hypothetical protein
MAYLDFQIPYPEQSAPYTDVMRISTDTLRKRIVDIDGMAYDNAFFSLYNENEIREEIANGNIKPFNGMTYADLMQQIEAAENSSF